jgi:hypothetical protein
MSTGPGPTRKADGTEDASVQEIADLLVEDETPVGQSAREDTPHEDTPHENLDVMLETPGPVASSFMPPPPVPVGDAGEDSEGAEEGSGATNLAYEDLLAKLVLPAKAPEPAPEMPALLGTLPLPQPDSELAAPLPALPRPSAHSLQAAPPADERTLVTDNPLIAEEQEAAYREGRAATRDQPVVAPEPRPLPGVLGMAKSKVVYLMLGGLLVLGGMILAVLVLKLLMPTPAPPAAPVVVPVPPPPPAAAPARVEPLPPSPPPAVVPIPAEPAAVAPIPAPEVIPEQPAAEPVKPAPAPKAHRPIGHKIRPKAAPKPVAPAAPKAPKPKKPSKTSGYADPFDN